jgi:hypothetical protein
MDNNRSAKLPRTMIDGRTKRMKSESVKSPARRGLFRSLQLESIAFTGIRDPFRLPMPSSLTPRTDDAEDLNACK